LSTSELVKTTLDHDSTDTLINKWLEHYNSGYDTYSELVPRSVDEGPEIPMVPVVFTM
ncbi:hypothetical protein BD779DRAFT_1493958, partial [Infundibulicybe gibba]